MMRLTSKKLSIFSICLIFIFLILSATSCLQKNTEIKQEDTFVNSARVQADSNNSNKKQIKNSLAIERERTADKTKGEISCSPQHLRKGDVLKINMKPPHGGYLEIITPTKEYIFLSELDGYEIVEESKKAGANPFFAASEFAKLKELEINTAQATTVNAEKEKVNGKYQLGKIFSVSGKYQILLSKDSFEIDDPTITGRCEIYYTNIDQ